MERIADGDLDSAISSLEYLARQLERAPSGLGNGELTAVIAESVNVAHTVLSGEESLQWNTVACSLLPDGEDSAVVRSSNDDDNNKHRLQACPNASCGASSHDDGLKKVCAFGCGVRFCNRCCWKQQRSEHEKKCNALQRKCILRKLGLVTGVHDESF